jgi:hypothetical protein
VPLTPIPICGWWLRSKLTGAEDNGSILLFSPKPLEVVAINSLTTYLRVEPRHHKIVDVPIAWPRVRPVGKGGVVVHEQRKISMALWGGGLAAREGGGVEVPESEDIAIQPVALDG